MATAQFHTVKVGNNSFHIDKRYTNLEPMGDGSYGFVASATDTVTGQNVAISKVKDTFLDVGDARRILREMQLLDHFDRHTNIIKVQDVMTSPPNAQHFDDIYIVTNLMESDLGRIIRSHQILPDQHMQYLLFQILRGLQHVHSADVLHRDLKPSTLRVNANCDLALCDFGPVVDLEYLVPHWYCPPELLLECACSKSLDVWSAGCIFAEMATRQPFFRGCNPEQQLQAIVSKLGECIYAFLNY
jgi:serine/threonine protein kinase